MTAFSDDKKIAISLSCGAVCAALACTAYNYLTKKTTIHEQRVPEYTQVKWKKLKGNDLLRNYYEHIILGQPGLLFDGRYPYMRDTYNKEGTLTPEYKTCLYGRIATVVHTL